VLVVVDEDALGAPGEGGPAGHVGRRAAGSEVVRLLEGGVADQDLGPPRDGSGPRQAQSDRGRGHPRSSIPGRSTHDGTPLGTYDGGPVGGAGLRTTRAAPHRRTTRVVPTGRADRSIKELSSSIRMVFTGVTGE